MNIFLLSDASVLGSWGGCLGSSCSWRKLMDSLVMGNRLAERGVVMVFLCW